MKAVWVTEVGSEFTLACSRHPRAASLHNTVTQAQSVCCKALDLFTPSGSFPIINE